MDSNVLFAIFEVSPFVSTGGLGDIGGALPAALKKKGCNIKVIMPKFLQIPDIYKNNMQHITNFYVPLAWRNQYCGIEKLEYNGVTYYFVDNEYYFYRDRLYDFWDDAERIAFFCKAVLESLQYVPELDCNILHCNDWHTALISVFLREFYHRIPLYDKIKTIFTIHNLKFQGIFPNSILGDVLGLEEKKAASDQLEFYGDVNLMKGALIYSDILTTVSPTYANEIHYAYFGERMEGIFQQRNDRLYGILNGIDTLIYNPEKDLHIKVHYNSGNLSGKLENKTELQERLGLCKKQDIPLIVMISRLTEQKGLDILLCILEELLGENVQIAILGTGEYCYESAITEIASRHPGQMSAILTFSRELSHLFYAGGDILVMPSRYEPCGLSQMIAMRYGTIPVVRETGGLKDSVKPYNKFTKEGNGFSFRNFNAHELLFALKNAIHIYCDEPAIWKHIVKQAMMSDFSWNQSALQYIGLYQKLLSE